MGNHQHGQQKLTEKSIRLTQKKPQMQ